jgi:carboxyl-terminal processing protease
MTAAVTSASFASELPVQKPSAATTEANITRLATDAMGEAQLIHRPFDAQLAAALLDRYEDALDPSRSVFLQSDVDELAGYSTGLAEAMRARGDTRVAHVVFGRYLARLAEQERFMADTLRAGHFDFSGHDSYSYDRRHAARPRDLPAAHELWREQLRAEYLQQKLEDRSPAQIVKTLSERHAQQVRTMKAVSGDEVLDLFLDALAHVYDPHSDYLGREDMASFAIAMNLSLVGVGATLENAEGACTIRDLVAGGPAAREGTLKPGDRIVAVAQEGKEPVETANLPLSRTVDMIRGPRGSKVLLSVLPAGAPDGATPQKVTLVRDAIKLEDQEAKAHIVELPTAGGATMRLGVIDLPGFYAATGEPEHGAVGRSATADVARLLRKLEAEHVRGVVLDVRHNGGGSLGEAVSLTGLFIPSGPVVQTRDASGAVQVDADEDPAVLYDGPLVVLTSRFSASATEILAGALQDYGRAVVVGDPSTFGKGTVQNVLPLAPIMDRLGLEHAFDPGALKVTISKFYRPSGASTQLRGVASDIVIPSLTDVADVNESSLDNPLPWDVVQPASYAALDRVRPYVATLREGSERRVASDPEMRALGADVAGERAEMAKKTVSLNEAARRTERAQAKTRLGEEQELASHQPVPRSYRITLQNAASPGLPAPEAPVAPAATSEAKKSALADSAVLAESERILASYVGLSEGTDRPRLAQSANISMPSASASAR